MQVTLYGWHMCEDVLPPVNRKVLILTDKNFVSLDRVVEPVDLSMPFEFFSNVKAWYPIPLPCYQDVSSHKKGV